MKNDNFYVTLPSNSSAENKLADFTTVLSEPLQLEGEYEVALVQMTYPSQTETDYGNFIIKNYFTEIFCYNMENYVDEIFIPINAESFINKKVDGEDELAINFTIRDSIQLEEKDFIEKLFDGTIDIKGILNNTITFVKIRIPLENTAKYYYAIPESIYKQYIEGTFHKTNFFNWNTSDNQSQIDDLIRFVKKNGWLYFDYEHLLKFYKGALVYDASLKIKVHFITYIFDDVKYSSPTTIHYLANIQEYDDVKNIDKLDLDSQKLVDCLKKPDNYFKDADKKDDPKINVTVEEEQVKILNATKEIKFPTAKTYDVRINKCEKELNEKLNYKLIKLPEFEIAPDILKLASYVSNAQYILQGRLAGILDDLSFDLHEIRLERAYFFNESIIENFYIAVYCDIIEPQYFGNKKIELIKCIPVVKELSKTALINYFDNPHYMPVRLNYINSIRIRLQDLFDNLIHFKSGAQFVIAKLHFRKIK